MGRSNVRYWCRDCGTESLRWQGQCPGCGEWNSLDEVAVRDTGPAPTAPGSLAPLYAPRPMGSVDVHGWRANPTGIAELDRVLDGGLVAGSVTLLGGEPGIGKSTLALQMAASVAARGERVLYLSGEEAAPQVRQRADRLGAVPDELWFAAESSLDAAVAAMDVVAPGLVVVDSVQTLADSSVGGAPGSMGQVRAVTARLVAEAKARPVTILVVGHVNKEGQLAGPRAMEHLVDTVLSFEGDRHHALRLLRAVKHRFGTTAELGVFEMTGRGLEAVDDPSAFFLADRVPGLPGSAVVPTLDGHRPLLVELQALTVASRLASPRRSAQGVDGGRLALLVAVLERRAGVALQQHDVYALAVGGSRISDPGADLALTLAVASAATGAAVPADVVASAEIGLAGELRRVVHAERRLAEAARLGFARAVVPPGTPVPDGLVALPAGSIGEAMARVGIPTEIEPRAARPELRVVEVGPTGHGSGPAGR
jgi:DNA repair protein RadA/Sms